MLCRVKDALWFYMPSANALTVMQRILVNVGQLMPLFCMNLQVHLAAALSFSEHIINNKLPLDAAHLLLRQRYRR